ncbi:heat stress transcription factor B-1-like [Dorcoceras hygrometricum]|uniref:Heat stress transcription factor B-1-like n=1 Tax=Dorcoceras hygrometricum TaxID=472368 RepID=A0A2Z7BR40_9LAMI|nr:heat stress transcription factor B-1-like [Dorcoceras hygrometricum]
MRPAATSRDSSPCSGYHCRSPFGWTTPGPDGSNVTNLGSNRGLTRENWSLQVDAPAMLRRRDHLLVFAFVLLTPATNAVALPTGPPPDQYGSNMTDLTSNHSTKAHKWRHAHCSPMHTAALNM